MCTATSYYSLKLIQSLIKVVENILFRANLLICLESVFIFINAESEEIYSTQNPKTINTVTSRWITWYGKTSQGLQGGYEQNRSAFLLSGIYLTEQGACTCAVVGL